MIRTFSSLFSGLVALLPLPALALSCMPWGLSDAYDEAEASSEEYVVVEGDLSFDTEALPKTEWDNQMATPQSTDIPARLHGMSLSTNGFSIPFDAALTLRIGCAGPWCAGAAEGPVLAFLRRETSGYVLVRGPCGGMLFDRPDADQLDWVVDRLNGDETR